MERSVLKNNAKSQLQGKWWITIAALLVAGLIGSVASGIVSLASEGLGVIVSLCLQGIVNFGIATYSLNIVKNNNAEFTDIFNGFNMDVLLKALILGIISMLATAAGMMLLVVPGIIIGLMFSQAFLIFAENPEMSPIDCIKESTEMMKGHKGEYFVLQLSFLGWGIFIAVVFAVLIGLGIYLKSMITVFLVVVGVIFVIVASLFLGAYTTITFANYYVSLKSSREVSELEDNQSEY